MTGAADTGIQFARLGFAVQVRLADNAEASSEVLVLDTNSRSLPPARASECVRRGARDIGPAARTYKKIDSTLRGNCGVEIAALMDVADRRAAIVAPAYPTNGRTTRGGVQRVHGVPVHETPMAADPTHPMPHRSIGDALRQHARRPATPFPLSVVAEGWERLAARFENVEGFVIVDAEDEGHLETIARAADAHRARCLPVGSAGLAAHLGRLWRSEGSATHRADAPCRACQRVLIVVGSQHPVSREQAAALARAGYPGVDPFAEGWGERARRALAGGVGVLAAPRAAGLTATEVAQRLAACAVTLRTEGPMDGIILTGGDTARAVLDRFGARAIDLECELEPGVPRGRVIGGGLDGTAVVTKAGGFGATATLLNALHNLRRSHD
ncbi:MAG: four-carbon acid sugar kinase family protein [Chloroflexi bacterium]|nr:four-carbon acid sugar kinase family protein [Chloroflexota bacterium]